MQQQQQAKQRRRRDRQIQVEPGVAQDRVRQQDSVQPDRAEGRIGADGGGERGGIGIGLL